VITTLGRRLALDKFGPASAEQRPQVGSIRVDRPFRHQRPVGHLVDLRLPVHGVFQRLAEQVDIAFGHLLAVETAPTR
jgi:hypothetical protein